jgi:hypothetical protein
MKPTLDFPALAKAAFNNEIIAAITGAVAEVPNALKNCPAFATR